MNMADKTAKLLNEVRQCSPLIHNITNYVTVNDCANAILAIGASPIMADDEKEAADITSISSALVLNIGTLNHRTVESMVLAGKKANEIKIPVVLDPVGAGASQLRNDTVRELIRQIHFSVIRGNLSEVSFVAGLPAFTKGVDSSDKDNEKDAVQVAKQAAASLGCTVAVTGAVDVITDGERVVQIYNGHPMLSRVTGTGCMTTALVGAFLGAGGETFTAAVSGVAAMGMAGEIAFREAGKKGTGSFHIAVIDALSRLDEKTVKEMAKFEETGN